MGQHKNLILCRVGDTSLHKNWLKQAEYKNFDVAISYYGDNPGRFAEDGIFYEHNKGTKYPTLYKFILNNIARFLEYEAIWLPDDDLDTDTKTINQMFSMFHENKLWLAQPSLTDSYYYHPITLRNEGLSFRHTNFVEVMAPLFSRQALLQCLFTFNESISGYGLDLIWPKILGWPTDKIAVLDSVSIRHTRPIGSGPVYKIFPVPPTDEMHHIAKKFECMPFNMTVYSAHF